MPFGANATGCSIMERSFIRCRSSGYRSIYESRLASPPTDKKGCTGTSLPMFLMQPVPSTRLNSDRRSSGSWSQLGMQTSLGCPVRGGTKPRWKRSDCLRNATQTSNGTVRVERMPGNECSTNQAVRSKLWPMPLETFCSLQRFQTGFAGGNRP